MQMRKAILFLLLTIPVFSLEIAVPQIYTTKEEPVASFYGPGKAQYFVRLYKIEKPVEFLQSQKDVHTAELSSERRSSGGFAMLRSFSENFKYSLYALARRHLRPAERDKIREFFHLKQYAYPYTDRFPTHNLYQPLTYPLAQEFSVQSSENSYWSPQEIRFPGLAPGFYLVEVSYGRHIAFSPLIVSDMAIHVREGVSTRLVYAWDLVREAPIQQAALKAFNNPWNGETKEILFRAAIKNGIYSDNEGAGKFSERTLYLAETKIGKEIHYALSDLDFYDRVHDKINSAIYTDRPVYRQGHEVFFRAVLLENNGGRPKPLRDSLAVFITEPGGKKIFSETMQTDKYGALNGSVLLAENATPGYYRISIKSDKGTEHSGFYLEQYKKPSFEVTVLTPEKIVYPGQKAEFHIQASYYSGEPVANAQVFYEIQQQRISYPWWWGFDYEWYYSGSEYSYWDTINTGELTTDANGKTIASENLPPTFQEDYKYRVVARVTGSTREEINGIAEITAARGSFSMRISQEAWYYTEGKSIDAKISLQNWSDKRPANNTVLSASLFRKLYEKNGHYRYDLIEKAEGKTGDNGNFTTSFKGTKHGYYAIIASARDSAGREVREETDFFVYSPWGDEGNATEKTLDIKAEKVKYELGETAKFRVVPPAGVREIVLIEESDDIITYRIKRTDGKPFTEEIKLSDPHTPNFRFSGFAFAMEKAPVAYSGDSSLVIPPVQRFLKVQILTDREKFRPGEEMTVAVRTLDNSGKPVPAAFSLGVVDEAIYAIRNDTTQDITRKLFPGRNLLVTHSNSLSFRFYGYSQEKALYAALASRDTAYAMMKEQADEITIRRNFKDTAHWLATGETGKTGEAIVTIKLPDNLTKWRFTVHASTQTAKAGSAIEKITVSKDLNLRLAMPRFLREKDEAVLSLLVTNRYAKPLQADLSLNIAGLTLKGNFPKSMLLPALSEQKIDFTVVATEPVPALLTATAKTSVESDGLEQGFPVLPYGVEETLSKAWSLKNDQKKLSEKMELPAGARDKAHSLTISWINGVLPAVAESLPYLIDYPYGCTEQTLSRFVPLQQSRILSAKTGIPLPVSASKIDEYTKMGLDILTAYQHSDGGWGWWENDETDPYMTAYALDGLRQAKEAGVKIPDSIFSKGIARAKQFLEARNLSDENQIYMEYVLSFFPEAKAFQTAKWAASIKQQKNPYLLALLSIAADNKSLPTLREEAIKKMIASSSESGDKLFFKRTDRNYWWYSDEEETTALALMALLRSAENAKKYAPRIASWMISSKQQQRWRSTKTTALMMKALSDYAAATGEKYGTYPVTVSTEGMTKTFSGRNSFETSLFLKPGNKSLPFTIEREGTGFFMVRADWKHYREVGILSPRDSQFKVRRAYYPVDQRKDKNGSFVYRTASSPASHFTSGDLIAIVTEISNVKNSQYFLLEDMLPAGVEDVKDIKIVTGSEDWAHSPSARVRLDDRISLSKTWFYRDTWKTVSVVRATFPGTYNAMPAQAGLMYYPETTAYSSGEVLTIKESP